LSIPLKPTCIELKIHHVQPSLVDNFTHVFKEEERRGEERRGEERRGRFF